VLVCVCANVYMCVCVCVCVCVWGVKRIYKRVLLTLFYVRRRRSDSNRLRACCRVRRVSRLRCASPRLPSPQMCSGRTSRYAKYVYMIHILREPKRIINNVSRKRVSQSDELFVTNYLSRTICHELCHYVISVLPKPHPTNSRTSR